MPRDGPTYHTGDYLEEDPTCFFNPADVTTVSEYEEETNRLFKKYLIVARHAGFYERPAPAGAQQTEQSLRRTG